MHGKDGGEDGMGAYLTTTVHLPKRYDIVLSGDYLQPDTESEKVFILRYPRSQ